jgi:hypothetical protein
LCLADPLDLWDAATKPFNHTCHSYVTSFAAGKRLDELGLITIMKIAMFSFIFPEVCKRRQSEKKFSPEIVSHLQDRGAAPVQNESDG